MYSSLMAYKNNKTSDPHRLILNLADNINLKNSVKYLLYQMLASTIHGEI